MNAQQYHLAVLHLPYGKVLPTARYIERSSVPKPLAAFVEDVARRCSIPGDCNVMKFSTQRFTISFLAYSTFWAEGHPGLDRALTVDLGTMMVKVRHYRGNVPILHRKESFLRPDDPRASIFAALTLQEVQYSLLGGHRIGFRDQWRRLLDARGLRVEGHDLLGRGTIRPAQASNH